MAEDITKKLEVLPEEVDRDELLKLLNSEQYEKVMQSRRLASEAKEAAQAPLREAIEKSKAASFKSGFKDWASGAPTTQEQTRSLYERLAKEAARDDIAKDVNIGLNKAMRESELARLSSKFEGLASAEQKLARQAALRSILGKGISFAGKALAPAAAMSGLYGGDIATEEQEAAALAGLKEEQENKEIARFKRLRSLQDQK